MGSVRMFGPLLRAFIYLKGCAPPILALMLLADLRRYPSAGRPDKALSPWPAEGLDPTSQ
jgi:hypothetical protein